MTDAKPTGTARRPRHRSWVLPIAAAPVVFIVFIVVAGLMQNTGDAMPAGLWKAPRWIAVAGSVGALLLGIVNLARVMLGAVRAQRDRVRTGRTGGFTDRLSDRDAERRGLTREEYGVYKGSVGSAVEPVNSAGGLLAISLLLSVIWAFLLVLFGVIIAQDAGLIARNPDDEGLSPVQWFFAAVSAVAPFWSWHLYRVERRAQKLRISRGRPRTLR